MLCTYFKNISNNGSCKCWSGHAGTWASWVVRTKQFRQSHSWQLKTSLQGALRQILLPPPSHDQPLLETFTCPYKHYFMPRSNYISFVFLLSVLCMCICAAACLCSLTFTQILFWTEPRRLLCNGRKNPLSFYPFFVTDLGSLSGEHRLCTNILVLTQIQARIISINEVFTALEMPNSSYWGISILINYTILCI